MKDHTYPEEQKMQAIERMVRHTLRLDFDQVKADIYIKISKQVDAAPNGRAKSMLASALVEHLEGEKDARI